MTTDYRKMADMMRRIEAEYPAAHMDVIAIGLGTVQATRKENAIYIKMDFLTNEGFVFELRSFT